eukprot:XP_014779489.1 PREDICTED: uncharacterized protein LOC106875748 [Octopus bimaculoides]
MDGMEDSGFDSDPKPVTQTEQLKKIENSNHAKNGAHIKALKKASELQKKIERQRDASRKTQNLAIDQQPKRSFLARNRSTVSKNDSSGPFNQDQQPLVAIMSDDRMVPDVFVHLTSDSKLCHLELLGSDPCQTAGDFVDDVPDLLDKFSWPDDI